MTFASLGLHPELVRVVADEGYQEPTPVQRQAIPLVLAGRDVLAGAQTGTGKTAAFVLPILQRLHATRRPGPGGTPVPRTAVRVLVLTPTRELALQVEESVRVYGRHLAASSVAIYGGVGMGPQVGALRRGSEIVVATPGRLLDHVGQRTIDLSRVEILVLDEADRMLDMGFIRDIRKVIALLPERRQNLLFSATFSDDIRELASGILRDPAGVDVAPRNTAAETVEQVVIPVDRERKRDLLRELVALGRIDRALVFARTKHGANRLAEQLVRDGIGAAAIHGNKSQSQRVRALDDFKAGRVALLVATDIAARGIDIDALPHVVNYELPMVPEDYIHRIGRTGRAGVGGEAVSLVCVDEAPLLRDIQRLLGRQIPSETIAGFEPTKGIPAQPIQLRSAEHQRAGGGRGRRGGQTPAQGQGRARLHGEAPAAAPSRRHTAPATSASHAPHAASEPSDARRPSAPSAPNRHRHGGTPRPGSPRPGASIGQAAAPGRRPAAGDRRTGATPRAGAGHPHTTTHSHTQAQVPSGDRRIVAMPGERIRRLEAAHSTDRQSQSQHQSKSHSHSKGSAR